MTRALFWRVLLIALLAVGLRIAYQAGMTAYGGSFNNGSDSGKYINVAIGILDYGQFARVDNDGDDAGELRDASNRMPAYMYFLAGMFDLFGKDNLRAIVTVQALFDGLSIFGIALAALAIGPALVIPAAIAAAIMPNLIVHASYILQENLFLVFFSWSLCSLLWAIRSPRPWLLLTVGGLLLGASMMTRLVVGYYPLFILPALAYALRKNGERSWLSSVALAAIPLIVMQAAGLPLRISNYLAYGYAGLSSQTGPHLLHWFYGCVATSWPCADRGSIVAFVKPLEAARVSAAGVADNPFAVSAIYTSLALELMWKLPFWHIPLGMAWGAFRNLIQTGFYEVLTQFKQPLTFLSAMPGNSASERLINFFLINKTNAFMIMWAVSEITLIVSRVFQALGLWYGLRSREWRGVVVLLVVSVIYFLAVNGPIGNPKYRFPMEPALILLFALGWSQSSIGARVNEWVAARLPFERRAAARGQTA